MADTVAEFFSGLESQVDPSKAVGMTATFQFNITGDDGGEWFVRIADGNVDLGKGTAPDASITLTIAAPDWLDLVNGKTSGQTAFLLGKLKIQGDMSLAMKLPSVFQLG